MTDDEIAELEIAAATDETKHNVVIVLKSGHTFTVEGSEEHCCDLIKKIHRGMADGSTVVISYRSNGWSTVDCSQVAAAYTETKDRRAVAALGEKKNG